MKKQKRFMRIREVLHRTGLCRSTMYRMIIEGKFPEGIRLGGYAVGWLENEVEAWVDAQIHERDRTAYSAENDK